MTLRQAHKVFKRWTWTPYLPRRKRAAYKSPTIDRAIYICFYRRGAR